MTTDANQNKKRLGQEALERVIASVGGPRRVADIYPLSPLQRGLLFHSLYEPDTAVYVISLACRLQGALDAEAFEQAWRLVVARHAVLRTAFVGHDLDVPLQVVLREAALPFIHEDWRHLPVAEQDQRFAELQRAERSRGFDFAQPPLMRLNLVRIGDHDHRLLWNVHHIVLDGWSLPLLLDEVFAAYAALSRRQAPLLSPARPFKDYVGWLQRQDMAKAEAYWRERLKGFDLPSSLTLARPRRDERHGERYAELSRDVEINLAALEGFAREHKLTMNTLVQGAWALLLGRYSGSEDVVFGVTLSGRPAELADVERTVGLFVNTLPLRVGLPGAATVLDWLREIQARQSELTDYQYSPLPLVQRWSSLADGNALFESILAYENYPVAMSAGADIARQLRIIDVQTTERTSYPLTLQIVIERSITVKLIYDAERFVAAALGRMIDHLGHLLCQIVADPERKLSSISLLSDAERGEIIAPAADPAAYRQHQCLHELFASQAGQTPEGVAVSCEDETLTYAALEQRANRLANHLRSLGVGPDVIVGLYAERSIDMVVGVLGILKAGGAYLPLDPSHPPERLAIMLEDAGARVRLAQDALAERLPATDAVVVRFEADGAAIARQPDTAPVTACVPDNLAYVIYTSGSTGRPKGTLITHACVTRLFAATEAWFGFGPQDVWTLFHSLAFDFSVWELWGPLLKGGRLVVVPYWISRSPEEFHALLSREGVTVLNQTPSAFAGLIRADRETSRPLALRTVIFGGEALNFAELAPWFERHGDTTPQLINMYGITETTVHVTWRLVRQADVGAAASAIGQTIPDLQAYVLDPRLEPMPIGVAGELYIGGVAICIVRD